MKGLTLMRFLLQAAIIFALWVIGEMISRGLQLPIPGSIIGMVLLFIMLSCRLIRLEWIEQVGEFSLDNMGLLFIPIGVSLLDMTNILGHNLLALIVITVVGVVMVMGVSGLVVQWLAGKANA
ncbi:MAG: CidA/LrgA family protein [Methylocystaceae bacterium]